MPVTFTVEQQQLTALSARLALEADGKRLKLELARNLRAAVAPAVSEIKATVSALHRSAASARLREISHQGTEVLSSIGAAIAAGVSARARMTGRSAGVVVRASKKGMPRKFYNAPKRMNAQSFRHKVFGRDVWVTQVGSPGFFDKPLHRDRVKYRVAIKVAMDEMAARIAR